ncbi:hypothetical protein AB0H43_12915 [Hamadaea sp. NPDC050747]|uniref:hypothetical protein n=1 Tax=Hamadaea sp. NPDC050747 TaxID=3155789 RepID=UPI003408C0D4
MDFTTLLRPARILVAVYGLLAAAVLGLVALLSATGHAVTGFMWGRSIAVLASAIVTYVFSGFAVRGARWAYLRMRIISVIVPPAIVAVDVFVGALPIWFVVLQASCAVVLAAAAVPINGSRLRAAFVRRPAPVRA